MDTRTIKEKLSEELYLSPDMVVIMAAIAVFLAALIVGVTA